LPPGCRPAQDVDQVFLRWRRRGGRSAALPEGNVIDTRGSPAPPEENLIDLLCGHLDGVAAP
jgi:hypothetical protein